MKKRCKGGQGWGQMDVCVNGMMDELMGRHLLHGWMGQ